MALLDTSLDTITERDLQRLIMTGAAESLYIDYKQKAYGNSESDHVECLADMVSFVNTMGGRRRHRHGRSQRHAAILHAFHGRCG